MEGFAIVHTIQNLWQRSFICLFCCLIFSNSGFAQVDAGKPDPMAQPKMQWMANNHFTIAEKDETTNIQMEKMAWEPFTLFVGELNLKENPFISFQIKSAKNIELRVDMVDHSNAPLTAMPITKKIRKGVSFQTVVYDFSKIIATLEASKITHFQFYVNPGKKYNGEIFIQNIKVGKAVLEAKTDLVNVAVFPNPANEELTISLEKNVFDEYRILDISGKNILSKNISPTLSQLINLEQLPSGFFLVQVFYKNEIVGKASFTKNKLEDGRH